MEPIWLAHYFQVAHRSRGKILSPAVTSDPARVPDPWQFWQAPLPGQREEGA